MAPCVQSWGSQPRRVRSPWDFVKLLLYLDIIGGDHVIFLARVKDFTGERERD